MQGATNHQIEAAARSLAQWWREAGVHSAAAPSPHRWRDGPPVPVWREPAAPASGPRIQLDQTSTAPVAQPQPAAQNSRPAAQDMPGDLAAFRVWAATDPAQPEAQWNTALFPLPEACTGKLLILTDMPGEDADPVSGPLAPAPGRFIGAMLAAIGLPQDQAAFATLALRRPPGGLLDESDLALLGGRLRHFLDLAAPRAVLILGDRTNRATFGTQRESHIKNLTEIRVGQGMIKLAALASPEHLMRRPAAKANSWASLRLLKGVFDA